MMHVDRFSIRHDKPKTTVADVMYGIQYEGLKLWPVAFKEENGVRLMGQHRADDFSSDRLAFQDRYFSLIVGERVFQEIKNLYNKYNPNDQSTIREDKNGIHLRRFALA